VQAPLSSPEMWSWDTLESQLARVPWNGRLQSLVENQRNTLFKGYTFSNHGFLSRWQAFLAGGAHPSIRQAFPAQSTAGFPNSINGTLSQLSQRQAFPAQSAAGVPSNRCSPFSTEPRCTQQFKPATGHLSTDGCMLCAHLLVGHQVCLPQVVYNLIPGLCKRIPLHHLVVQLIDTNTTEVVERV